MTISSTNRKSGPYTRNGIATDYPFDFVVFTTADVLVISTDLGGVESTLIENVDYTVTLNADQDNNPGGTVTMAGAGTVGFLLTFTSDVGETQTDDIQNLGGFYPEIFERALDKLTVLVQQVKEKVSRAVLTDISSSISPSVLLAELAADVGAAAASAAEAEATLAQFRGSYYGAAVSDPASDPNGEAVDLGDAYWNSSTSKLRVFNGTDWQDTSAVVATTEVANYTKGIPTTSTTGALVATDAGKCVKVTGGITIPANVIPVENVVSIYNDSAAAVTLTQGSGLTLRLGGTTMTGDRALAARGMATVWFLSGTEAVLAGSGVS